ncbi:MAG: MHS family MFS transporter [Fimbriimonadaceae bacterium]|nr:MHS family MFS transporter [Fimbriimonadaceae bacterium]
MAETADPKTLRKVIVASSVGTLIEWYDFYIFGALAALIGSQFFAEGDSIVGFLKALATFAVGFVVRPFGALVFGRLGDLVGRKYTFLITLVLMGGSTFVIGLLPGYAQIGVAAPIILVTLRMIQGLALGGEYGGAATYVAEHCPPERRGYYTSFIQTTATLGLVLSLIVLLLVERSVGTEAFNAWWWRLPFLLSAALLVVSLFIRLSMKESPLFAKLKEKGEVSKNPLRESFVNPENRRLVLLALFGATAGQGVVWYTGQFYAMSFMEKTLGLPRDGVWTVMMVSLLLATPLFVVFGHLSDRIGRKKLMMLGCGLAVLLDVPLFMGLQAAGVDKVDPNWLMAGGIVFLQVVFVTMVYGPIAAFLVELFPTRIRYTSMSLPYHIGNGVFGGLVPLISTAVVANTGNQLSGLIYPLAVAAITVVIGTMLLPETVGTRHGDELHASET